jgi:Na+/H+ antiporter NhaD/arsenite permease-like protein
LSLTAFFDILAKYFARVTKGKSMVFGILFPFTIYATSLFMNNLSVILLMTFIGLKLAVKLRIPVAPMLVSAVIASNIGGCPLPWADTPAVVLTLYSDFSLVDFLKQLFIPCLIYALLLSIYTIIWFKHEEKKISLPQIGSMDFRNTCEPLNKKAPALKHKPHPLGHIDRKRVLPHIKHEPLHKEKGPLNKENHHTGLIYTHDDSQMVIPAPPHHHHPKPPKRPCEAPGVNMAGNEEDHAEPAKNDKGLRDMILPLLLFAALIISICIAPFFNISIAYVSLFFGAVLLLVIRENPEEIITSLTVLDSLVFISTLFLIAATLEYSGVLEAFVNYLIDFTGNNRAFILLCIMICAFLIATFLSAGPAAATLLPICQQLSPVVGGKLVYAALALGILAGSSMLPWSATGGPILLSEVKRFLKQFNGTHMEREQINKIFSLKNYLLFSIPFSFIILFLSGLSLILYLRIFVP